MIPVSGSVTGFFCQKNSGNIKRREETEIPIREIKSCQKPTGGVGSDIWLFYQPHYKQKKSLKTCFIYYFRCPGSKYQMSVKSQGYKYTALLRVRNMSREDIGSYYCYAENSMGSARDDVTVYSK